MDSQYQKQYETINSQSRIVTLLSQAFELQSELKITLPKSSKAFNSQLTYIPANGKYLLIKKLDDYLAHSKLLNEKILNIYINVGGADISFTSKFLKIYHHHEEEQYAVELPSAIKYHQRRAAYRVHVSLAMDIKAQMVDQEGKTYTGQLRDISSDGMKVQFTRIDAEKFASQAVLPNCKIQLPDNSDILCSFRIRHLQENNRKNGFSMGGDFVSLEQGDKRIIERFIASLERKSMRTMRA